jgi:hypothetical protein
MERKGTGVLAMVDFAMAASQNGVCITQEIWHIFFRFDNCSMAKAESNKKFNIFCYVLKCCESL